MRIPAASLISILSIVLAATSSLAKPAPPGNLETAYTVFTQLGDKLDASDWDEAMVLNFKTYEIFRGVVPELSETMSTKTILEYRELLEKLRTSLSERNEARCRRICAALEVLFLDTLENYSFETHPVLKIIHQHIVSAEETLARGDAHSLSVDLRKIGFLFEDVQQTLEEKGIARKELFEFRKDLIVAEEFAVVNDVPSASQAVEKLRKTTEAFLRRN